MNLCEQCQHARFPIAGNPDEDLSGEAMCFHTDIAPNYISPVTGGVIRKMVPCLHARSSHGKCGPEGALYSEVTDA